MEAFKTRISVFMIESSTNGRPMDNKVYKKKSLEKLEESS